jgi:hypothetical protein
VPPVGVAVICLTSFGLRATEGRWIPVFASRRLRSYMFFLVWLGFVSSSGRRIPIQPLSRRSVQPCQRECGGVSPADPTRFGQCLSTMDLLGSSLRSSTFVCLRVGIFQSTHLFISDGCCFGASVLWGFSTTTFRLSTTTRFVRLS